MCRLSRRNRSCRRFCSYDRCEGALKSFGAGGRSTPWPIGVEHSLLQKPTAQLIAHDPLMHVGDPLFVQKAFMHAPQFYVFVVVLISLPFVLMLLQLANVTTHDVISQAPVAHDVLAFA